MFDVYGLGAQKALSTLGIRPEFSKLANVGLDQYKRLISEFEKAYESYRGASAPSKGLALHGMLHPASLKSALRYGRIPEAVETSERAQHGPGVYWWKGWPSVNGPWLTGAESEGIATPLETLPGKLPPQFKQYQPRRNAEGEIIPELAPMEQISRTDYVIRPNDLVIINTPSPEYYDLLDLVKERKAEPVDSNIFHVARQDFHKKVSPGLYRGPALTDQEVRDLYNRRMAAPKETGLRPEYVPQPTMAGTAPGKYREPLDAEELEAIAAEKGVPAGWLDHYTGNVLPPHKRQKKLKL